MLALIASRPALPAETSGVLKTRTVVLIVSDGLRWQEIFTGADPELLNEKNGGIWENERELRRERATTDAAIEAWAAGLTAEHLAAPFSYRSSAGQRYDHPLWWAVIHFFNHQTHHRGQLTTLLTQLGHDSGVTDLVSLLREPS